jgi:hypothetical protein
VLDRIDAGEIIAFRDALAHGRVSTTDGLPMTVVKFGRPDPLTGQVMVEFRQELTADYLQTRITQTRTLMLQVDALLKKEFGA